MRKRLFGLAFSTLAFAGLAFVMVGCGGCGKGGKTRIEGGGSSFVNPLMEKWAQVYESKGTQVDYASIGSGNGVANMIGRKVDFGATDAPMNEKQLTEAGGPDAVIHVPLVMGAVVITYNLPDLDKPVRFTGDVVADIYLGKITRWNDKRLQFLNRNLDLPDLKISVVRRSDSSGTSYIFTDYLSKVHEEWKEKVGKGTNPTWPIGQGEPKNNGVAQAVTGNKGAIGYVELIYALKNPKLKYGLMKNQAGEFVEPSMEGVTAAADSMLKDIPDDLRFSIVNAPGKESYPISGTVWAVVYVKQPREKVKPLTDFLRWVIHDGQEYAKDLHYARLPKGLVEKTDKKIDRVEAE